MALTSGTKLGPYEIDLPLGAGGMGEVYRARDTRLDRTVAIKILPAHLSSDPVRRQRFEREAKTISSLNHPHICTLHDIGSQDGIDYLVMECVEGETLAKRLERGPLPLEQVLKYGAQIADALDKAHRSGVVHRDLKPGNIILTSTGAKLLDFGLAKPTTAFAVATTVTASAKNSPVTEQGMIVGTFQYMSPEQVEGRELDGRSDIFSLGTVLYEMVTGKRAFEGKSQLSVASAILEKEPVQISSIKPMTPPMLDHVVKKCLAKDPDERWQSASDLASQLSWVTQADSRAGFSTSVQARRLRRERLAWIAVVIVLTLIAIVATRPWSQREPQRPLVTTLQLPSKVRLVVAGINGPPRISPDGTRVAFVANEGGNQNIWVRALEAPAATRVPGTDGAYSPFWSPDSHWLAFFANGKLRKVEVSGGSPQDICAVADDRGGSWGTEGTILLTPKGRSSEIYKVADSGGEPVQVTKFQKGINSHRWPYFLPDGKHFLYLASPMGSINPKNQIRMASVDGKEDKLILFASSNPEFVDGRLLFVRDGTLITAPMDAKSGKITGQARTLLQSVAYDSWYSSGVFSVSASGMLLYQGGGMGTELQWMSATGKSLGQLGPSALYGSLRISPDDKRVAVSAAQTSGTDNWIVDVTRGTITRITFNPTVPASAPSWSPDGDSIAYSAVGDNGRLKLFVTKADGTGELQHVAGFDEDRDEWLTDWSPDGRYLLFFTLDPKNQQDVWALPVDGSGKLIPVAHGPNNEFNGRFSPDGRWVAFVSDESGRNEVYLVPFRHGQGKQQVSTQGADDLIWARDGKTLYYASGQDEIWSVPVVIRGDSVELGTSQRMFKIPIRIVSSGSFDVTRDGRLLINTMGDADEPMALVQNWNALLNH